MDHSRDFKNGAWNATIDADSGRTLAYEFGNSWHHASNMSLHCLSEGSSSVFPVQVCHDTTIAGLIEQVQRKAGQGEVSFVELELWKVRLLASS